MKSEHTTRRNFVCKSALSEGDEDRCHYAMNPNCKPNSPAHMVFLFESKGDWNQFGGPELLAPENHNGKGCNILFNDGRVEFVPTQRLSELKWKPDPEGTRK
jgi:prepilin-type processing-associated H-X9-DG protein